MSLSPSLREDMTGVNPTGSQEYRDLQEQRRALGAEQTVEQLGAAVEKFLHSIEATQSRLQFEPSLTGINPMLQASAAAALQLNNHFTPAMQTAASAAQATGEAMAALQTKVDQLAESVGAAMKAMFPGSPFLPNGHANGFQG
jgi:hypothetical protein